MALYHGFFSNNYLSSGTEMGRETLFNHFPYLKVTVKNRVNITNGKSPWRNLKNIKYQNQNDKHQMSNIKMSNIYISKIQMLKMCQILKWEVSKYC